MTALSSDLISKKAHCGFSYEWLNCTVARLEILSPWTVKLEQMAESAGCEGRCRVWHKLHRYPIAMQPDCRAPLDQVLLYARHPPAVFRAAGVIKMKGVTDEK